MIDSNREERLAGGLLATAERLTNELAALNGRKGGE